MWSNMQYAAWLFPDVFWCYYILIDIYVYTYAYIFSCFSYVLAIICSWLAGCRHWWVELRRTRARGAQHRLQGRIKAAFHPALGFSGGWFGDLSDSFLLIYNMIFLIYIYIFKYRLYDYTDMIILIWMCLLFLVICACCTSGCGGGCVFVLRAGSGIAVGPRRFRTKAHAPIWTRHN